MRTAFTLAALLVACGGDAPAPDLAPAVTDMAHADLDTTNECADLRAQFDALVAANRACSVDSDCSWIADGCFDPPLCYAFINGKGAAAAYALVDRGKSACVCATCMVLQAACNQGTCGPRHVP